LSDSGSSALPAYPGFIVMKAIAFGFSLVSTPSNTNVSARARSASSTLLYCVEHTESTETLIRLNSSKQPQAPVCARPR